MIRQYVILSIILCPLFMFANEEWSAKRIQGEITLDGRLDESAWQTLPHIPLVQQSPDFDQPSKLKTEMMLGYTNQFIYVGARCFVDDPSEISLNTKKRDALTGATDWIGVVFDSYNDNENALAFFANPNAVRWDGAIFNDAIGRNPLNMDWNTFWDVNTSRDANGWYAEIRIPWKSLNISSVEGLVEMGIIASRWSAHYNENDIFPAIAPEWGDWSGMKPSLSYDTQFEGIKRKKPLYIAPYILAGVETQNELNETTNEYDYSRKNRLEPGLDAKVGVTDNLTLDLSVNTDFAQVEADDQQVNLTRFSLFFPEKRLFFQERAGIFNFGFGRQENLFYSRRIGIEDDAPTRIYGGARLTGRAGAWNIGLLNMHAASAESENGRNFSVARLQKTVFNGRSNAGVMLVNKTDFNGDYHTAYGLDAVFRYGKSQELTVRWAQSFADGHENEFLSLNPTRVFINFAKRVERGFNYGFVFARTGKDFDPEMGFQQRDDFTRFAGRIDYGFFPENSKWIFRHGPTIFQSTYFGNAKSNLQTYFGRWEYSIATKSGYNAELGYTAQFDQVVEPFELTDQITINVGEYHFYKVGLEAGTPFSNAWQLFMSAEMGTLYGNDLINFSLTPTWAVSSSLELSGTYIFNRLRHIQQPLTDVLHLARLKALVMFSTKLSVASFIQLNTQSKKMGANIRLRYNPREGNDLYLVYNSNSNLDRFRELPTLPKNEVSTFILKYTYTFSL